MITITGNFSFQLEEQLLKRQREGEGVEKEREQKDLPHALFSPRSAA
jgi:hypothetical protein